jgi:hypothetical protein
MRRLLIFIVAAWAVLTIFYFALRSAHALTPPERKLVERILQQAEIAKGANTALKAANEQLAAEAEQATISASNANKVAGMAASSAFQAGLSARNALKEAEDCKKQVAEWEPIIKAVTGPWYFPGFNALLYGIKKCSISLLVIVAALVVILVVIKVTTGLSFGALFNPIINFFSKIPGWISRAGTTVTSGLKKLKPKPKPKP